MNNESRILKCEELLDLIKQKVGYRQFTYVDILPFIATERSIYKAYGGHRGWLVATLWRLCHAQHYLEFVGSATVNHRTLSTYRLKEGKEPLNRFVANADENPPEWGVWDTDCISGEMQVRVAVCPDEATAIMVAKALNLTSASVS